MQKDRQHYKVHLGWKLNDTQESCAREQSCQHSRKFIWDIKYVFYYKQAILLLTQLKYVKCKFKKVKCKTSVNNNNDDDDDDIDDDDDDDDNIYYLYCAFSIK